MPIHDWTRVSAGTWHAFHLSWIAELQIALNDGRMPPDYYALAEQFAGPLGPDVLTLQVNPDSLNGSKVTNGDGQGGLTVAAARPRTRMTAKSEMLDYILKRRTLSIRHTSDDQIIALIELLSPGNKASERALRAFVDKAVEALYRGYHLLIVDLFPPTRRAPLGIHAAIWDAIGEDAQPMPADEPLTLAAYLAGPAKEAFVEPTAVGRAMIDMPLFLTDETYVNVPLEETYARAYRGFPRRWRDVLEAPPAPG